MNSVYNDFIFVIGIPVHLDDVSFEKKLELSKQKATAQRLVAICSGMQP